MKPSASRYSKYLLSLAANIRKLRLENKLTQQELAEEIDVELRYLQKLESGEKNPSIAVVIAIAQTFNVKVDDLLENAAYEKLKRGRPRKAG